MNTTHRVIEFLTSPGLPFGTAEDLLLLEDPESLQGRVASLLEECPTVLGEAASAELKSRLDEAAWSFIAMEYQERLDTAARISRENARALKNTQSG